MYTQKYLGNTENKKVQQTKVAQPKSAKDMNLFWCINSSYKYRGSSCILTSS